jgi:D-ribose pyranase
MVRPAKALMRMLEKMSIYILEGEGYSTASEPEAHSLMKTNGILNSGLIEVMARMGHGDMLVVTDRGFPFPLHDLTKAVDLSVAKDFPRFLEVLKPIVDDFEIEEAIIAIETKTVSPAVYEAILGILSKKKNRGKEIKITLIPHAKFKDLVLHGAERGEPVACFVKTGEFTPYANVILVSSVPF